MAFYVGAHCFLAVGSGKNLHLDQYWKQGLKEGLGQCC